MQAVDRAKSIISKDKVDPFFHVALSLLKKNIFYVPDLQRDWKINKK